MNAVPPDDVVLCHDRHLGLCHFFLNLRRAAPQGQAGRIWPAGHRLDAPDIDPLLHGNQVAATFSHNC